MDDRRYEELARRLADYPGRWVAWPEPFGTRAEADALFDSAALRWRIDEFKSIVDGRGLIWMEVSCAW